MTENIVWHNGNVSKKDKSKLLGFQNKVVWLTGLSGSGKSTIARYFEKKLHELGIPSYVLDGDNVRHGLNGDLGFSGKDREENIRRIGEVTKLFYDSGLMVITAFISPFRKDRDFVRNLIGNDFIEVYVDCSLDVCESRDPKGLYKKVRSGEIKEFTGISSPYEEPLSPEIYLNTSELSLENSVKKILTKILDANSINKIDNFKKLSEQKSSSNKKTPYLNLSKELEIAKSLAIKAGEEIMSIYYTLTKEDIEFKSDNSPLTKADLIANEIIVSGLKKAYPNYAILTEESEDDFLRLKNDYVWIIDPLDGTKEFISKNGEFTVNIALVYKNEPILGVVYLPVKKELYFADKYNGAYLVDSSGENKISVSEIDLIKDMALVRSRSHTSEKLLNLINNNNFKNIIPAGSSLKGCLVAKGDADVYFRLGNINEWDVCAMNAIISAAGGIMTDLAGNILKYNKEEVLMNGFVVSNNKIHDVLLSKLD